MNRIFDIESLLANSGLSKGKVRALTREVVKEFPGDELMQELHVVRAIMHEKGLRHEHVTAQA
ncbi:hypothetical protein A3K71_05935 [archaeon RBG_16_50_20]|nr:MAG: hypothetical protein A3K71_05935 [archaeon RBG_16_50_20]